MSDLKVIVEQKDAVIEFSNFEEIRAMLSEKMQEYNGATFTEDSKQYAKGELASLRKLKASIDTRRKEVKASYMDPYNQFESKVKELTALVDEPIGLIDKQVKAFDEKQREEKRQKCMSEYDSRIGDMREYLPFEKIFDSKWLNAGTSMKSIVEDIQKQISNTEAAIDSIKAFGSEREDHAIQVYMNTLDVIKAIDVINRYEREKAEILLREEKHRKEEEDRRQQMETERAKAEEREAIAKENQIREEARREAAEKVKQENEIKSKLAKIEEEPFFENEDSEELPFETPSTVTAFYKVVAAPEELERVEMAFHSIGIYFERRDA